MSSPTPTNRPIDSQKGWASLTSVLALHVPFRLTQGGNARKALYALMHPRTR